ncbi:hypothetical protein ACFL40_06190 [candidate division KSB1 bacterium]
MKFRQFLINTFVAAVRLLRYNMKIIFANKFIYFLSGAVFIFIAVTAVNLFYIETTIDKETIYWTLLVPGILIIFYPITFGIQNDSDNRMLELVFGIPNYRYKVQLLRVFLIFVIAFTVLFAFILFCNFIIIPLTIFEMLYHIIFPILFLGSTAFLISTFIKDGSGTAVIMIITIVVFWIARDFFQSNPKWDIFLNPFSLPEGFSETVWDEIIIQNRIYLFVGSILAILYSLMNLQKRERLL